MAVRIGVFRRALAPMFGMTEDEARFYTRKILPSGGPGRPNAESPKLTNKHSALGMLAPAAPTQIEGEAYALGFGSLPPAGSSCWLQPPGQLTMLLAEVAEAHKPGAGAKALDGGPLLIGPTLADALGTLVALDMNDPHFGPSLQEHALACGLYVRLTGSPVRSGKPAFPVAAVVGFVENGQPVESYFYDELPAHAPMVRIVSIGPDLILALADLWSGQLPCRALPKPRRKNGAETGHNPRSTPLSDSKPARLPGRASQSPLISQPFVCDFIGEPTRTQARASPKKEPQCVPPPKRQPPHPTV